MLTSVTVYLNAYSAPVTEGNKIDTLFTLLNSGRRRRDQ